MGAGEVEIERKYDVAAAAVLPSLVGVGPVASADRADAFDLDATYYDTAGLALGERRIAVRRRLGGHDEGWHIKWPPGAEGRVEQQFPLGAGDDLPPEVRQAIAEYVGDEPLVPIARIRNHRIATVLRGAGGEALVELADDHVHAIDLRPGDTHGAERRWQEWEAELLPAAAGGEASDRAALLDAIEARLLAAGARPPSSGSKLARALGLVR
jgi:hypothetical protein